VTAGRVLRVPAEVMRDLIAAWFPLGGHLIQGLYRTARSLRRPRGSASRWPPSARSPRARAFEPFFTTKNPAEHTGLGPDIARRIITERHVPGGVNRMRAQEVT
jgi:hypothetical protein